MSLIIPHCLNQAQLANVAKLYPLLSWRDGAETAGALAKPLKRNEQADLSTRDGARLKTVLADAISSNTTFQSVAWPKALSPLIVSRTTKDGGYGWHSDDALMKIRASQLRTDLSFTLFLTPPEEYEGGALEIHTQGSIESHKLVAGDMVLYPSGALHRVDTVTKGARIACVGWVESLIRNAQQREILSDLFSLRETLQNRYLPETPEILSLSKTISNLLRQWSEP